MCLFSWQKQARESAGVQLHNKKMMEKIGIERARTISPWRLLGKEQILVASSESQVNNFLYWFKLHKDHEQQLHGTNISALPMDSSA